MSATKPLTFFSQKLIRQLPEKFLRNLTLSYKVCTAILMPAASNRSLISVSEIIFRAFPAAKGVTKMNNLFGWLVGEIAAQT